ncbi:MAG: ABC transporter permease [Parabacteroides sp.]|nr:ABC transporter permease [Parabacteroides sp.]
MKQFLVFVRKEFYHILRDKRSMMVLLGIPIVQIVLFGFAITTEVKNSRVAIFDPSKDVYTRQIAERIQANAYFDVLYILDSPSQIDQLFKKGEADMVVVFGDNFAGQINHTGEAAIQLITDATDPNQATTMSGYATNIIRDWQQERAQTMQVPIQIKPVIKMLYNPEMKAAYNFVPGVMGMIFMLICAMMTAIAIVREKETGTMEVLLASPMRPLFIILAKAVPYLTLSLVNFTSILVISVYLLNVPVAGSLGWLFVLSLLFIIVALSLGLLISTVVDTQVAAMLASGMVLIMPVVLLSGMIYPVENMPLVLQWFSNIIPAKWYIIAVKKLMIEGLTVVSVVKEMALLSLMAATLITISMKKFKKRLE